MLSGIRQVSVFFSYTGSGWLQPVPTSYPDGDLRRHSMSVPRGKQCLLFRRLNLNLVTHHHEVAGIPLGEVSRESCSVSA